MGHPVCTDIETYQIEHGHAGKVPRRDPVRGAHVALEVRDLLEELQAVLAEQPLVNLLHVQEEAVEVAHGLAHRAHVLLARVHRLGRLGSVQGDVAPRLLLLRHDGHDGILDVQSELVSLRRLRFLRDLASLVDYEVSVVFVVVVILYCLVVYKNAVFRVVFETSYGATCL